MQIVQTNILFLPTAGLIVIIPSSLRLLLCSWSNMLHLQVWTTLVRDNLSHGFPPFSQIQPNAPPESLYPCTVLHYSPFFLFQSTVERREKSLFPPSLQQPLTWLHLCYCISSWSGLYSKQPQFFQPSFIGYVFKLSHCSSWIDSISLLKCGAPGWIQCSSWDLQHRGVTFLALLWSALLLYFVFHSTKNRAKLSTTEGKAGFLCARNHHFLTESQKITPVESELNWSALLWLASWFWALHNP